MFHDKRLVVIIMVMAVSSTLISQQLSGILQVYASKSSPYDSGYDHGCDDAGRSESDKYINQPEKGPSFHTNAFMDGYYAGLNACSSGGGSNGGGGFEQPSQPPSSQRGGIDWNAACQIAHTVLGLQTPCDELVTPNNELTDKGEQVLACYGGGALAPLLGPAAAAQLYTLGRAICPP
jgi:hypothetical protein